MNRITVALVISLVALLVMAAPAVAAKPKLSVANAKVVEGKKGQFPRLAFKIKLSRKTGKKVTVRFTTVNGSAKAGKDYVARKGTVTFKPGTTVRTVKVKVKGDNVDEKVETLKLKLSSPTRAVFGDRVGLGKIIDDDGPALRVRDAADVTEQGFGQDPTMTFKVTLSKASPQQISVDVDTANGTTENNDYEAVSRKLIFKPGQTSKSVAVKISGDVNDEDDETLHLVATKVLNARKVDGRGSGIIRDDDCTGSDPGPGAAVNLGSVVGDAGTGNKQLTRNDSIDCTNEVHWYKFGLTEEDTGITADELTARILLIPGAPPQGTGDLDLCVYRGPDPTNDLVECSREGAGVTESVVVTKTDGSGDSSTNVWVKVFPHSKGPVPYQLRIIGDI